VVVVQVAGDGRWVGGGSGGRWGACRGAPRVGGVGVGVCWARVEVWVSVWCVAVGWGGCSDDRQSWG